MFRDLAGRTFEFQEFSPPLVTMTDILNYPLHHHQPPLPLLPDGTLAPMPPDNRRVSVSPVLGRGETQLTFYASDDEDRAMTVQLKDCGSFVMYRYMVCCFFDIPCVEAARIMCVSLSLVKRIRSWARLGCWPCSLIHSGVHPEYTREWVVQRRNEVILSLEEKFVRQPSSMLGLAVAILKNVRVYAEIYRGLVIPGAGRRAPMGGTAKKVKKKTVKKEGELKIKIKLGRIGKKEGMAVKEIMESMKPVKPVKQCAVSCNFWEERPLQTTPAEEEEEPLLPLHPLLQEEWISSSGGICQSILSSPSSSFCQELDTLYANDAILEVEDELGLGPARAPPSRSVV